jgi:hypothetical protein
MSSNHFTWRSAEHVGNTAEIPEYHRAGQDCICDICGKEYRKHPHEKFGDGDFALELFKKCNGEWVKL